MATLQTALLLVVKNYLLPSRTKKTRFVVRASTASTHEKLDLIVNKNVLNAPKASKLFRELLLLLVFADGCLDASNPDDFQLFFSQYPIARKTLHVLTLHTDYFNPSATLFKLLSTAQEWCLPLEVTVFAQPPTSQLRQDLPILPALRPFPSVKKFHLDLQRFFDFKGAEGWSLHVINQRLSKFPHSTWLCLNTPDIMYDSSPPATLTNLETLDIELVFDNRGLNEDVLLSILDRDTFARINHLLIEEPTIYAHSEVTQRLKNVEKITFL